MGRVVFVSNPDGKSQPKDPTAFCKALDTWATLAIEAEQIQADAWRHVRSQIAKSSLLRRLLYEGEELRTEKCPVHQGKWSGLFMEKPEGCLCMTGNGAEASGWIPNPPKEATK